MRLLVNQRQKNNGIGQETAKILGFASQNKVQYNAEEDIAKAEAEVNRAPNVELLDHEYKRALEIKCIEFQDLMEGKGFTEEEIQAKVDEYRKLLYTDFESGKTKDMDSQLDLRNSHSRAKVAKDNRDKMRFALGIDAAFVDGTSLEKIKKATEKEAAKLGINPESEKDTENALIEKLMEKIKAKKRKHSSSEDEKKPKSKRSKMTSTSKPVLKEVKKESPSPPPRREDRRREDQSRAHRDNDRSENGRSNRERSRDKSSDRRGHRHSTSDRTREDRRRERDTSPERSHKGRDTSPERREHRHSISDRSPERSRKGRETSPDRRGDRHSTSDRTREDRRRERDTSPDRSRKEREISPDRSRKGRDKSPERSRKGRDISPEHSRKGRDTSPDRRGARHTTSDRSREDRRRERETSPERSRKGRDTSSDRSRSSDSSSEDEKKHKSKKAKTTSTSKPVLKEVKKETPSPSPSPRREDQSRAHRDNDRSENGRSNRERSRDKSSDRRGHRHSTSDRTREDRRQEREISPERSRKGRETSTDRREDRYTTSDRSREDRRRERETSPDRSRKAREISPERSRKGRDRSPERSRKGRDTSSDRRGHRRSTSDRSHEDRRRERDTSSDRSSNENSATPPMAYFDCDELADCIRHEFHIEDDSGICSKVLPKPCRRPRNYGPSKALPNDKSDHEASDTSLDNPDIANTSVHNTSKAVRDHLVGRLTEFDRAQLYKCSAHQPSTSTALDLTIFEATIPKVDENSIPKTSMVSRLLSSKVPSQVEEVAFAEYARFEAMDGQSVSSKTITIVFPFAEEEECPENDSGVSQRHDKRSKKKRRCAIPIRIVSTGKISDLIGLSCYVYTRMNKKPRCEHPKNYSLYLAEDNLDYDTELPPQDRHRCVADCGFPVLAMVKNSDVLQYHQKALHQIRVYFVNGRCFTFELESLDTPLQQIFDRALESKQSESSDLLKEEQNRRDSDLSTPMRRIQWFRQLEYILEPLERTSTFIGPLKLENTISSTGVTDFLLLRKNSSRGDFDRNPLLRTDLDFDEFSGMQQEYSKATTPGIYHMASSAEMLGDQAGRYDHPLRSLDSPGMETLDTFPNFPNIGIVLEEFTVDRLHRIKPKWPAKFIIREDCVEVSPILLDLRKKGSAKAAQKFTQIPIDMIASVEVHHAERSNSKRIVRITYLRVPAAMQRAFLQAIMQCDSTTMESALPHSPLSSSVDGCLIAAPGAGDVGRVHWHLGHIYEASSWKNFQMEATSDDAWRIGIRINDIMDGRQSQVRTVFQNSQVGTRRPLQAFEAAFGASAYGATLPFGPISPMPHSMSTGQELSHKMNRQLSTISNMEQSAGPSGSKAGQSSKKKTAKRITSTAGAVLSRMLSRQE
ncbi:SAPK-interacting protein 1 (Sin1), middle CRIM domain-containing protein [Ditylenchus destructor]|uniref:Target of rapamycin complex 2 subunit MAPKAP1 n=1 Tax=Ditylenchus destructor TaxID=166010 RepID=A0AAD4MWS7_9BILA|nr:SAPK-interacting protein 1 (Sin1), middle CRIM domain-containing protein [Ditylenchus destructor]